jgi:hypothetical protein
MLAVYIFPTLVVKSDLQYNIYLRAERAGFDSQQGRASFCHGVQTGSEVPPAFVLVVKVVSASCRRKDLP